PQQAPLHAARAAPRIAEPPARPQAGLGPQEHPQPRQGLPTDLTPGTASHLHAGRTLAPAPIRLCSPLIVLPGDPQHDLCPRRLVLGELLSHSQRERRHPLGLASASKSEETSPPLNNGPSARQTVRSAHAADSRLRALPD